jgi:hypothetical protein
MSCYVRHLTAQMATAGLPDDRAGRREADRRVREALGLRDADCPDVWRRVKALPPDEVLAILRRSSAPGA